MCVVTHSNRVSFQPPRCCQIMRAMDSCKYIEYRRVTNRGNRNSMEKQHRGRGGAEQDIGPSRTNRKLKSQINWISKSECFDVNANYLAKRVPKH